MFVLGMRRDNAFNKFVFTLIDEFNTQYNSSDVDARNLTI